MNDKEKIRAEIERLLNKEWKWGRSTEAKFRCEAYRELLEFIDSMQEEPFDYTNATITQKDFAEPVSNDLEEAASDYVFKEHKSPLSMIIHQADLKAETQYINDCESCFIAGAKWDREQMMKDAIEAVINSKENDLILYQSLPAFITKNGWHKGDKVKLNIVKEAEK